MDAKSGAAVETKVNLVDWTWSLIRLAFSFRMNELLSRKANVTYSDLVVIPDDSDMDVQGDASNEVTPPPIRYFFNS